MPKSDLPLDLTICIPHLNDCDNLDILLHSIWKSDLRDIKYEILVCDGFSNDRIHYLIDKWGKKIRVFLIQTIDNANASINLNAGLNNSRGKVFCRVDSRCIVNTNFFKIGLEIFNSRKKEICALGPTATILPMHKGIIPELTSKLYHSPFLFGPSKFKNSYFYRFFEGKVSTIYLGFFDQKELKLINGFDEKLKRKQDIELLNRLKLHTKKYLLNSAKLKLVYKLAQDQPIPLAKRAYNQGKFLTTKISSSRIIHFVPLLTVILFIFLSLKFNSIFQVSIIIYLLACYLFSHLEINSFFQAFFGILLFPLVHLAYIIGNLRGLIDGIRSLILIK